MKNPFSLSLIILLLPLIVSSQSQQTEKPAFIKKQMEFEEWSKGKDLKNEKGWKLYKRWESQMLHRANGDGSLPDEYEYFNVATQVANAKSDLQVVQKGISWVPVGPSAAPMTVGRINCIAFHPTDSNTYWVGVAQGGVWKTTNGGNSYLPLTDNLPILRISDIAVDPQRPDTMYIAVGDYAYLGIALFTDGRKRNTHYGVGIYKTVDGGVSWQPTGLSLNQTDFDGSLIRRTFISTSSPDELLAAGTGGIWKSSNGGTSWNKILDTLIWDIERDPVNKNTLYASGGFVVNLNEGYACIMKSTDFGNTWTMLNTGIIPKDSVQRVEIAIAPSDPNYIYAICSDRNAGFYGLYRSTDAGASWTQRSNSPNVLDWGNGGSTGGQGTYDLSILVDPANKQKVYTSGINLWGSSDGGATMTKVTDNIHPDMHMLAYNPLNKKTYLCQDAGLYVTSSLKLSPKNSTVWTQVTNGMQIPSFYRVATSKNNAGYLAAGAQDNGTMYFDGNTWIFAGGGDGMDCTIDDANPQIIITSSQFGYFEKSTDGGQTSNSINISGEATEWTTPILRDPSNTNILYAGYTNIHKSTDGGDNWSPISSMGGTPVTAIAVCGQNSNYIYFTQRVQGSTMSGGSVWRTTDGGTNWSNITAGLPDTLYFTGITVDDDNGNTAWVTCGGFYPGVKVFKTTDGGATWTNISYNLPNIPVNCIVHHAGSSNNTLYIGCDVGVYAIDDSFSSWQPYYIGLPNVIVDDLEIHYASNTLYAATFGRGIWSYDLSNSVSVQSQNLDESHLTIHPTLNNGNFNLEIFSPDASSGRFEVIDITGRIVFRDEILLSGIATTRNYNLILKYGLYFAKFSFNKGGSRVQRFMVE